jgi:hypothetical protein
VVVGRVMHDELLWPLRCVTTERVVRSPNGELEARGDSRTVTARARGVLTARETLLPRGKLVHFRHR